MKDASFVVQRGSNQSILFNIFTTEAAATRLNVTGKPVRAVIKAAEGSPTLINKACREVDAANGQVALDLTPAESRLIPEGRKVQVEVCVWDGGTQTTVGRGRVTGLGGINLDS